MSNAPAISHCDYCHLPVRVSRHAASSDSPVYCCFGCEFAASVVRSSGERGQAVWMLTRLGLAAFLTMCVMMCSIYLYGREVYEGEATAHAASTDIAAILRYASLLLSTPVLFLLGLPILSAARAQWRSGIVSTDALVVLGVISAYVYSYVATLRGSGATYFETACMILVLVTLGRWFEAVGKLHATERIKSLESLLPDTVRVRRGDGETTLPLSDLQIGDILLFCPGDRISADGVVTSGRSHVDEQLVTGESIAVVRQPGDFVRAGTLNVDGELAIRATSVGAETTLGRLVALLEAARAARGRYERLADRAATYFLPFTLVLALIGGIGGWMRGGVNEAIMSALSVLLIACPCGLGIATPMAVWMALGRAAARGAMFRSGAAIEELARVGTVFFDKTGTLTTSAPRVESITTAVDVAESTVMAMAAGLARSSRHSVSRGLLDHAEFRGTAPAHLSDVTTVPGRGLVAAGGQGLVRLGNVAMMQEAECTLSAPIQAAIDAAVALGRSIVCIGWGGRVTGVFTLTESLRPESKSTLRDMLDIDCDVAILTGDHPARGKALAMELGVETFAGLLPADKVGRVAAASSPQRLVAMVGDGLNDAPAMAAADVGIAMGCGADVTREAAAICLLGNDLSALPWLIRLARRTVRTIRVNLFWVFFYNGIGLALAVTGRLSPVVAALAMVFSSLFVIGNSLRLGADGESHMRGARRDPNVLAAPPIRAPIEPLGATP